MANTSDYRVRKCTDGKFRIFNSCEAEMWGRKPIEEKHWMTDRGAERGYPTRQAAIDSLTNFTYRDCLR